jgi:hypothetical protein
MNKVLSIAGILLIVVAVVYFVVSASSLPVWWPGYDPTLSRMHYKHGAGALVVGAGLLAYVWFRSRGK